MIPSYHRSGIELSYCISMPWWVMECWHMHAAQVWMHFVPVSQQLVDTSSYAVLLKLQH